MLFKCTSLNMGPPSTQSATLQHIARVQKHKKHILLQHASARPHTSQTTMAIEKLDTTILCHRPRTSNLAPCDLCLRPKMKEIFVDMPVDSWKGLSEPGREDIMWSSL